MKICILGDTHFGMRGDSILFHEYYKKFYEEVFFPYLLSNGIKIIFQLGDLFDRRKFINFNSLYLARKYFFDICRDEGIELHTLLGNHDVSFKNTLQVNSSELLLREYDNISIYRDFSKVSFDDTIDIVPWICDENEEEIMNQISQSKSQICFGHFEISGFEMDRGNVCHDGIDKKLLERYDVVLTGHFHHKSSSGNITYVGTPGEMTWADYQDERGFHIFDTSTRELTFIRNPYTMFNKLCYDDTENDFDYYKKFNYEQFKNTYVKIVVVKKTNAFLFDSVIDNLIKSGAADVSIVEEFTDMSITQDEELVNQAEDTITILSKYIDGLQTNVESDKLKNLMRELYVESLNVETSE